jgi:hypothetical protein
MQNVLFSSPTSYCQEKIYIVILCLFDPHVDMHPIISDVICHYILNHLRVAYDVAYGVYTEQ